MVRFRKGFGIVVFSVFDAQPLIIRWWGGLGGGRQPSLAGDAGRGSGGYSPPSKINYLISVSVRFSIRFGSVGVALKPCMKPTLFMEAGSRPHF